MEDDMLKDAIETSRNVLEGITDFETQGKEEEEEEKAQSQSHG